MNQKQNFLSWILITVMITLFTHQATYSQGKFAPTLRTLIGKSFNNENEIPGLKRFTHHEGTMITDIDDPEPQFLDVLLKGSKGVVVLSVVPDTSSKIHHILDVIEVNNIPNGWEVRMVGCQEGETEGQIIVALVNPGKGEYVKYVKRAWLCNRDKLRFQYINAKHIKCMNVGAD